MIERDGMRERERESARKCGFSSACVLATLRHQGAAVCVWGRADGGARVRARASIKRDRWLWLAFAIRFQLGLLRSLERIRRARPLKPLNNLPNLGSWSAMLLAIPIPIHTDTRELECQLDWIVGLFISRALGGGGLATKLLHSFVCTEIS